MISVSIRNTPPDAIYWRPYFRDGVYGVGGGGTTYWPDRLLIDEGWEVDLPEGLGKFFRVDLYDANRNIIYEYQTYFAGYVIEDGKHYIYDYAEWLRPSTATTRYFFTVAQGKTRDEVEADAQNKEIYGSYRLVLETRNAPTWMLSSLTWLINAVRAPLRTVNVELTGARVAGRSIILEMGGGTPVVVIVGIIVGVVLALGVIFAITYWKVQQEITRQLTLKLEIAETTHRAAQDVLDDPDLSPEAKKTLLELIYKMGIEGTRTNLLEIEGTDWGKYLKWGMVGAGVLAATAIVLPRIIRR